MIGAAQKGQTDCLRLLIGRGADLDHKNKDGYTALMRSARNGYPDCLQLLISGGASLNIQNNEKETALIKAAQKGYPECVRHLLRANANFYLKSKGRTALMFAKENKKNECVKIIEAVRRLDVVEC